MAGPGRRHNVAAGAGGGAERIPGGCGTLHGCGTHAGWDPGWDGWVRDLAQLPPSCDAHAMMREEARGADPGWVPNGCVTNATAAGASPHAFGRLGDVRRCEDRRNLGPAAGGN